MAKGSQYKKPGVSKGRLIIIKVKIYLVLLFICSKIPGGHPDFNLRQGKSHSNDEENAYTFKIQALLDDTVTCKSKRNDPTGQLQTKSNSYNESLPVTGDIEENERVELTSYTAIMSKIYELSKFNKADCPLR